MLDVVLAACGGLAVVLALLSRRLRELPLSEPLVAVALGIVLGPRLADVVRLGAEPYAILHLAAELVLAVSLMEIALRHSLAEIRGVLVAVVVLVGPVMVATAALGAGLAAGLLAAPVTVAWVLGAAWAPTDPVLASSIISGRPAARDLPSRLRAMMSTESAANDALAFALVGIGVAVLIGQPWTAGLGDVATRLAVAIPVGLVLGVAAGRLVHWADEHHEIEHAAFLAFTIALAVAVLGAANALGAEGLLAVYVAGLAYDDQISPGERREEWQVAEAVNRVLVLPVFVLLGVALPWSDWAAGGWPLALTVVAVLALRRLPLLVALARSLRLSLVEATFLGWFGPVGIAALFYLSGAVEQGALEPAHWAAGVAVIAASTLAHGVTAATGRRRLARHEPSADA